MAIIELNEAPTGMSMGGRFTPKANQKKFRSAWAVKGSGGAQGFPGEGDLKQNIPFGHGSNKAISGYTVFEDKGAQNKINFNGLELIEMVIPKEDADAKTKWDGDVSSANINNQKIEQIDKAARQGVKIDPKELEDVIVPITHK